MRFAGATLPLPDGSPLATADRRVILGVRPTGFMRPDGTAEASDATLQATPSIVEDLGDERYVFFDVDAPRVDTEATRAADDALLFPEDKARFTARLPADAPVTIGEPLALAINTDRLHFFDPDSGEALT